MLFSSIMTLCLTKYFAPRVATIFASTFAFALMIGEPARAMAQSTASPKAPPTSTRPVWAGALDSALTAELARTGTPGAQVAVVVNGALAYTRGYGVADNETNRPVTEHTLFRVGSVTKMVTAAMMSQLAENGVLDMQAPISTYVPEIAGKRVGAVTTHQLLTHNAGWLDNAVAYGRMGEGALGEVFREITDTMFFTDAGRVFSYSNPGYSMAGYVAEKAGKARFATLTDQLVIKKMGMPFATFKPLDALTRDFSQGHQARPSASPLVVRPFTENTAQWAAGFLFASTAELARFTMTLMNGGMLEGTRVLSANAVTRMTTGHQTVPGSTTSRYGYGLRISPTSAGLVWEHGGSINGFDANVTMYPEKKFSVIVLDNLSGAPLQGITELVARHAANIMVSTPEKPPAERAATPSERTALVGTYKHGGTVMTLGVQNSALMFQQGTVSVPVQMVGPDRLTVALPTGNTLRFIVVRDASGTVQYLSQGSRALARQP